MHSLVMEKQGRSDSALAAQHHGAIRAGSLAVRISREEEDITAAQALRYRVFYDEMGGAPTAQMHTCVRDFDIFDDYCDHLIVRDCEQPAGHRQVVGTYRLLKRSAMRTLGRFYSESEFAIGAITSQAGEILELGRSCVDARYRNRAVMQLLWRGIAAYVARHNITLMFGCASFLGTSAADHAAALSYLHHYHLAPEALRMSALPDRYVEMNRMARASVDAKKAFAALPALIKGYLRLGGVVGQGAVIDRQCNTLDVGIAVKTEQIADRYAQRYAASPGQSAT